MRSMPDYRPRLVDALLTELLAGLPAVLLVGPRATGKTTTAAQHARTIVRLDREPEAIAFRSDPDAALREQEEPVLIDEWQLVPGVLGAIKRAVDADARPGRFLITGSVRADLEAAGWPMTGRVVRVPMYGMTIKEQLGRLGTPPLIDRIVNGDGLTLPPEVPDLRDYVDLALRGGYPEPVLHMSTADRRTWLDSYVQQVLTRDVPQLDGPRDTLRMRRWAEAYALNSAGVVSDATLYDAAGVDRRTSVAYERLLTNLMLIDAIPAWTTNRLRRLTQAPKRYLVDPSLMVALLRVDTRAVMRDGNLLGRLLDTFVASQLRAELPVSTARPHLYHLRQSEGRNEIDLIAELGAERLVAFEVKATAAPKAGDAQHLVWLRDNLGDRFVAGVVFHTGPRRYRLGDGIDAVPICALWG
jgi:predicted AAA+ superfamily ATPase